MERYQSMDMPGFKRITQIHHELETEFKPSIRTLFATRAKNLSEVRNLCRIASGRRIAFTGGPKTSGREEKTPAAEKFSPDSVLIEKIKQRETVIDELREFEARIRSTDRLKGKSFRLIEEERLRKAKYLEVMKLESTLLEMVLKFETNHQRPFVYQGCKFRTVLTTAIERRSGNVEIIGLNHPMSTQAFARHRTLSKSHQSKQFGF